MNMSSRKVTEPSATGRPLSIVLLVRSLEVGGAERQLAELAIGLSRRGHQVCVAVFYRRGLFIDALEREGIEIIDLAKRGRWEVVRFVRRDQESLRRVRPDLIYSFLGGANIVAVLVRRAVPGVKLVWSVRSSDLDLGRYDWTHRLGYRIERSLATVPDLIIANSRAGRDFAISRGFPEPRFAVVANGIDTDRFSPNRSLRTKQRRAWRIGNDTILVGCLARLDPMKDHATFLRAGALVAADREDIFLACVGNGPELASLKALALELGIERRTLFAHNADAVMALNAFDIACSSSFTEGFPNAVAEAMACGRSCVVTDAGDSAEIVGKCGTIVPSRDPEALATGISRKIELRSRTRSTAARQRIIEHFSVDQMVDRTIAEFEEIVRRQTGVQGLATCAA